MNICGVEIELFDKPVGILCSGGADSSILLYLLAKYTSHEIHVFTTATNAKGRSNVKPTINVVEKIIQLTGNINIVHHIRYLETQNIRALVLPTEPFFNNGSIHVMYSGETANPPEDVLARFNGTQDADTLQRRNPNKVRPTYMEKEFGRICNPFLNIDKVKIAEIYKEYGLVDSLFPLTRSCETLDKELQDAQAHCGVCWWCEERQWAFSRLI